MTYVERAILYFDGASRNNPHGPAGCGFTIVEMDDNGADGRVIWDGYEYLGYNISNNQAEYYGLIKGLEYVRDELNLNCLYIRGDSEIVINQLNGVYQVRSERLIGLYNDTNQLLHNLNDYRLKHVSRSMNSRSDYLANKAIDEEDDDFWYH